MTEETQKTPNDKKLLKEKFLLEFFKDPESGPTGSNKINCKFVSGRSFGPTATKLTRWYSTLDYLTCLFSWKIEIFPRKNGTWRIYFQRRTWEMENLFISGRSHSLDRAVVCSTTTILRASWILKIMGSQQRAAGRRRRLAGHRRRRRRRAGYFASFCAKIIISYHTAVGVGEARGANHESRVHAFFIRTKGLPS